MRIQAEDNLERAQGILSLYDAMKGRVADLTRSHYAIRALDWIFAHPVFSSRHFVIDAGIPAASARRFLRVMVDDGILFLVVPSRGRRPGVFLFRDLVNIAQGTPAVAAHS